MRESDDVSMNVCLGGLYRAGALARKRQRGVTINGRRARTRADPPARIVWYARVEGAEVLDPPPAYGRWCASGEDPSRDPAPTPRPHPPHAPTPPRATVPSGAPRISDQRKTQHRTDMEAAQRNSTHSIGLRTAGQRRSREHDAHRRGAHSTTDPASIESQNIRTRRPTPVLAKTVKRGAIWGLGLPISTATDHSGFGPPSPGVT